MELVRYRAGEAIRWLQTGADNIRRGATTKGKSVVNQTGVDQRTFGQNLKTAAGALVDYGRGAYAEMMHKQAEASEYILQEDRFDVVHGSSIQSIPYERVKAISLKTDRGVLTLDKGSVSIKPFAHIVSGRAKVPIGWSRNGIEVAYELIFEELAARCGVELEEE